MEIPPRRDDATRMLAVEASSAVDPAQPRMTRALHCFREQGPAVHETFVRPEAAVDRLLAGRAPRDRARGRSAR